MITVMHVALNNCPGYIIWEAEAILSKLKKSASQSYALRLKLSRSNMFYLADIRIDFSEKHLSVSSKSRYLMDALEDSFAKISALLHSRNDHHMTTSVMQVSNNENDPKGK